MGIYVVLESEEAHKAHKAFIAGLADGVYLVPRGKISLAYRYRQYVCRLIGVGAEMVEKVA